MSLEMKYFVLKPRANKLVDPHATASQKAMVAYANVIYPHDPNLAKELIEWASAEQERQQTVEG